MFTRCTHGAKESKWCKLHFYEVFSVPLLFYFLSWRVMSFIVDGVCLSSMLHSH